MSGRTPRIVVIGGGVTGLAAAFRLKQLADAAQERIECVVLEQESRFGGKIRTRRQDGFVLELGPDSMLARKPEGGRLIRNLGITAEVVGGNPAAQKTYILHDGQLVPLPHGTNMGIPVDLPPLLRSPLLTSAQKVRVLLETALPKQSRAHDVSLGNLLRRRLGDALVDRLVEPLLGGIYAGRVDDLSLAATYPQFGRLEDTHRSLILGSRLERAKAETAAAATRTAAPELTGRSAFITLQHGLETLIERLYDCLHPWADLRTGAQVTSLQRIDPHAYRLTVSTSGGSQSIAADAVVCTTPAYAAADLLSPWLPQAALLRDIPYVSTATVILAWPDSQVASQLDASGFLVPRAQGRAITASTWVSSKWPHTTPAGHVMIRSYVGRSGEEEGLQLDDDSMIRVVRDELSRILQIDASPEFAVVTRWHRAMPQYHVHHLNRVRDVEAALASSAPGVRLAGAGYYGLGIPDCIRQGEAAAEQTWSHLALAAPPTSE